MGFNKAMVLKRFSIDNWIDYGRAKYYLEKNKWDVEAATKQYKDELVDDENAKDLTLSRHLRIVKHTSEESEKHILMPGQHISVEADEEIILLKEGDDLEHKEMKMDELIRKVPKLDVGRAKFFLDKCNWNLQIAKNLAESDDPSISNAGGHMKKFPSQYIDIVDDQVVCRYFEDTGPEPESELDLFYVLRERYKFTNGETVYLLKKADWNFVVAAYLSDLYVAYKKYGVYHFEFREKLDEFLDDVYKIYLENEPLKEIVQRMEEHHTFDRDKIAQMEFCKTYKLFKEKEVKLTSEDVKKSFDFTKVAKANEGEDVPLETGFVIRQGETLDNNMKILAFTYWTSTDNETARIILEKVEWNMIDAFKLDDCLKSTWKPGRKTKLLELAKEHFGIVKEFNTLEEELKDKPRSIETDMARELAEKHFKNLQGYEEFLNELFGRSYIKKADVLKLAKECSKILVEFENFQKELSWHPDWIDFEKAMKLAEKCFTKDYEEFLIELLNPPYVNTGRTLRLAEKYFEMNTDFKDFKTLLDKQPDSMKIKEAWKLAEEHFKDREGYEDLLNELRNLSSFNKEKILDVARKYFRRNRAYQLFYKKVKNIPFSVKSKDVMKLAEEHFKDREGYKIFCIHLLSPQEVDIERAKSVAEKYFCYTKEYPLFKYDVDEYSMDIESEDIATLILKYFEDTKGYDDLSKELRCLSYIDRRRTKFLAEKYCGYKSQYEEFEREVDEGFGRRYAKRLAEKYFKNSEDYETFLSKLDNEDIDKEVAKFLVRKRYGYETVYKKFAKEVDDHEGDFGRNEAKRLAEKYFKDVKGYDELLQKLDKYDIDKHITKYLVKARYGRRWIYGEFRDKVDRYTSFGREDAKSLVKEYFKDFKDVEELLQKLDSQEIDKEIAKYLGGRYCGQISKYTDFAMDVKKHKNFGREVAKKLAGKYFDDLEGYGQLLIELDSQEVDKEKAIFLAKYRYGYKSQYKDFENDVKKHVAGFGIVQVKKLVERYFKDNKDYKNFLLKLDRFARFDRTKVVDEAQKFFGKTEEFKFFEMEVKEGFGMEHAKRLAEKYFKNSEHYEEFWKKLVEHKEMDREIAKYEARDFFWNTEEYEGFEMEVNSHLESFGRKEAKRVAEKHLKNCESYNDLKKELENQTLSRERVKYLAKKYCGYRKEYKDFEERMNDYPSTIENEDVMKLAEKHFQKYEKYEDFLSELFRLPSIDSERAKILGRSYFGKNEEYKNFEKELNEHPESLEREDAKKLAKKHFERFKGYRKFSKELQRLPKSRRDEVDPIVNKYFGSPKEFTDFAEQMRNLPNKVQEKEAKKLATIHFEKLSGYGNFLYYLLHLPYIDRERAKMKAKQNFGSNKKYECFKEEMEKNHPHSIKREEALKLAEKYFKKSEEYCYLENKINEFPEILQSEEIIKLGKDYFEYNKEYEEFERDLQKLPSIIEKQKFKKLNISDVIRCLSIWTGLDYGQLIHIYRAEEDKLLWPSMRKLAVIRENHKKFKLDEYFLQTDLLIKEIENIVADVPRFATKKNELTRLKGKNDVTIEIVEGTDEKRTDEKIEDRFGFAHVPVDLDLVLYKNGVLFEGELFKYDWLVNLKSALRGDRPFKPEYMDKEVRYYFRNRMDERCPIDKLRFYLHDFYKKKYDEEDREEAKKAEKAAKEAAKKAKAEEEEIERKVKKALKAFDAEMEIEA